MKFYSVYYFVWCVSLSTITLRFIYAVICINYFLFLITFPCIDIPQLV